MNMKKTAGLICCVLGLANLSYAGGGPKLRLFHPKTSRNFLPGVPGQGFAPLSVANLELGRMMIQPTLPQIGGTAYTRQVALGNRISQFAPKVSERLVASRVLASQFPGFEMNFPKSYAAFKESTDLSWTRELTDMLKTAYGLQAQFAGSFETSLQDVFTLNDNLPFKWNSANVALEDAWFAGMKKTSGFFTIRVKSPVVPEGTDILLLDMANRRFISLNKSVFEVKREAAKTSAAPNYEPLPAGNLQVGQALLAQQMTGTDFPGYVADFSKTFRTFKEESGLSLTEELKKTLDSYGPEVRFSGSFVPSFSRVANYLQTATSWTEEGKLALNDAWVGGMQQKSGFFVIGVRAKGDPLSSGDVLVLDVQNRHFISLNQSQSVAYQSKLDAQKPVGDLAVGQAMLAKQVNWTKVPGYVADFSKTLQQVEKDFGPHEWMKILREHDGGAYFYVQYTPSLENVVAFQPVPHYISNYPGNHDDQIRLGYGFTASDWYDAINQAKQNGSGFLVTFKMRRQDVSDKTQLPYVDEDMLILDLENKRFISLEKSRRLAENHK